MEGGREEPPRPIVTFFQPRSSLEAEPGLFSLFAGADGAVQKFLPKSHVSKVIIRDNTSVQRMQEVKLRHLESSQRKTCHYLEHMKKAFMHNQMNKMDRWQHQYSHYQRMLDLMDQRALQAAVSSTVGLNVQNSSVQIQLQKKQSAIQKE